MSIMRPIIFTSNVLPINFLILVFLLFSCSKNEKTDPYSCNYTDVVDSLYREDAQRILFAEIYADSMHEDRNNPYFDEKKVDQILDAFQAVYDLDIPERDTVIELYDIHVFPWLGMRSISIQTDTAAPEVKKLIHSEPTGNDKLDSIVNQYKFTEVSVSLYYPEFNWITIIAEKPLNLFPIMEELENLPFFYQVGFGGGAIGDGNTIELNRDGQVFKLDFSIGWGDCPSGCLYRKHWVFVVDGFCNATFFQSY
jgi:hypothetical protein